MTYSYCCVYSTKTPDGGQKTCLKHTEFYSKNKFEKLVHLIGFIIRIYHDARSSECQIPQTSLNRRVGGHRATLDISEKRKTSLPCQQSPRDSLVVKTTAQSYQLHYCGSHSLIFYGDTRTHQIIILLSVFCLLAHGPAL